MSYWTGLVEGFQQRRELEFLKNYQAEESNRQMADKVYTHLLQSRDPQMQELALSGLASPINRKQGLAGFLGGVESNPMMAQILARMNEQIPAEGAGGGPAPPRPGSAAMSTNQPVRAGSAPLEPLPDLSGQPEGPPEMMEGGGPPAAPPMGAQAGAPGVGMPPPAAPPESQFKRRGTGIPTAEEIAEASAAAQMRGRSQAMVTQLQAAGATPEEIENALLGMAGAPRNQRTLSAVTQWGVQLTPDGPVQPVLLDQAKGYVMAGGVPIPPNAQMVRMTGGGSVPRRNVVRDPASPTGYSAVYLDTSTGEEMYRTPSEYTPPPAFGATTTITDPNEPSVPVRAGVPRGGGQPVPIGDAPGTVESRQMTDAKALIDIINRRMQEERRPGLPVRPGQRDQVTREEAQKLGLTFRTYAEAVRASQSTPEVTPRERATGGSAAERVRRRLEQQGGIAAPPPARPPARTGGAGPLQ